MLKLPWVVDVCSQFWQGFEMEEALTCDHNI